MGANGFIGANTEELNANADKLTSFAENLRTNLDSLKSNIDEVGAEGIFGDSAQKLLEVYLELNKDLHTYADTLDQLASNVKQSSNNKVEIDTSSASHLVYEG
ncbi:WXG100 family type VII secretion target [Butyrivibrio sp. INlla21]|uniref:WXG100 family type VII secretion target n=1 Tax=Butyrivibrio sp. INlla21 TaxID=1520811 RepID=UPI0008EA6CC0|nr:WXG100 family type VII secretion target [Butyrivibrio sp. INlla21]SFU69390.1 WXG100 family type VII secretion target [Butyrivibrio sp. INlla21]